MQELRIGREQARRYIVNRDLLARKGSSSPTAVTDAVRHLEYVQVDPVYVVERNHNLVLRARLSGYDPAHLDGALYGSPALIEVPGYMRIIVPVEDYPLFRPRFDRAQAIYPKQYAHAQPLMDTVLKRIAAEGPLSSAEFEQQDRMPSWWQASARAVSHALNLLWFSGQLAVASRQNNRQYFDLPERVVPPGILAAAPADPQLELTLKYLQAYGLGFPGDPQYGWLSQPTAARVGLSERLLAAGRAVKVWVEGAAKPYYAPAADTARLVDSGPALASVRLLPPLDNLLASRRRLAEVFAFAYTWEIYLKPERRTYGPYVLPILHGDRLVGRLSPALDRSKGVFTVQGLWLEPDFAPTPAFLDAFADELRHFAGFHGAGAITMTGPWPRALPVPRLN
ncbi:MAG: crosslink repair DNA glycosylase YcaQ family protein [Bacillota bacterium]